MVGVCLTGIELLHVSIAMGGKQTIVDDLLSGDALLFLITTLASYFALRGPVPGPIVPAGTLGRRGLHRRDAAADSSLLPHHLYPELLTGRV
ncbi:hypothetical protein NHF48_011225 [Sphingomonas sp. H160509]|uniref:hypothetical protein n=1 Tax=Sphingomonas sp. H160509 TaxID=2955313 RepID=UPI0021E6EB10|nr:hypothetical protein [Sphingomonas sp. H160509]MDD1451409.1 hypothetical protein [Sphingomonas sp. H160509]